MPRKIAQGGTWAIIPACNEEKTIKRIAQAVHKKVDNLIVVDDGSRDHTAQEARAAGVTVLSHIVNLGKGAAMKTGCDYAVDHGAGIIVLIDADGQHDPEDIPKFLSPIRSGKIDIVFGARNMDENMPPVFKVGNNAINMAISVFYRIHMKDSQCGFRAMTKEAYQKVRWESLGYAVESEMIANAGKASLRSKEIPIKTVYADRYKGTTVIDGIKILLNLLWWKIIK